MSGVFDDDHNHRRIAAQSVEVSCSICLELVIDVGTRSTAKLQCGHQFHLDCIGSAFNTKGAMQCPNCRNVEMGRWLYANGSTRAIPEFFMEDWIPQEDLYALSYPELQYRVRWCPFGELSQPASLEELEPTTTTYHNEFHGHHATTVNHSYLAYVGPGPATTLRTSDNNHTTDDHPWNSHSNDHSHQLAVAPQYHHHSSLFSLPGVHVVDGEIEYSAAQGIPHPHPFLLSYRYNTRTSPAINASTQIREHLHTQHHERQHHHVNGPNLRGLPPPRPPPFIYPPPNSSRHREPETNHFHSRERDWFQHFHVPSNHRTISSFWHRRF